MIYKIVGEGYAGEPTSLEFKSKGGKVCVSFEIEEATGIFVDVDAYELVELLEHLKLKHVPCAEQQIDEIVDGYRPYSRKLSETYKPFSKYLNELMYLQSLAQWDK